MIYLSYCNSNNKTFLHSLAYNLLEIGLKSQYNLNLNELRISKNEYGKPYFSNCNDIHFNISHCTNMAVCCIDNNNIGIDVEDIKNLNKYAFNKVLSEFEKCQVDKAIDKNKEFFRFWTLKESFVKNIGVGISYPLKEIIFELTDKNIISNQNKNFIQYIIENKFVVSVCKDNDMKNCVKYISTHNNICEEVEVIQWKKLSL